MNERVAVIGLGYVGLPLAVALARRMPTVGFDIDAERVAELAAGRDRTNEVDGATLAASTLVRTADPAALDGCSVFIVTVPTRSMPATGPIWARCGPPAGRSARRSGRARSWSWKAPSIRA